MSKRNKKSNEVTTSNETATAVEPTAIEETATAVEPTGDAQPKKKGPKVGKQQTNKEEFIVACWEAAARGEGPSGVAKALGMTEGNVYQRIQRIKEKLGPNAKECFPEFKSQRGKPQEEVLSLAQKIAARYRKMTLEGSQESTDSQESGSSSEVA